MKNCLILATCLLLFSCRLSAPSYLLPQQVYQNSMVEFLPHHGDGRFQNYLAMNIQYQPISELFQQLNHQLGGKLKQRDEAHITVITPPEFDDVLSKVLSIEDIDKVARQRNIQSSDFSVTCLGKGEVSANNQSLETYFVVVESPSLFKIREEIAALYIERGGNVGEFNANAFYPHITVGFNPRDLHLSDGIVKDKQSCFAALRS